MYFRSLLSCSISPCQNWFATLRHLGGGAWAVPLSFFSPSNFRHKPYIICHPQYKGGSLSGSLVLGMAYDRLCVRNICRAKKTINTRLCRSFLFVLPHVDNDHTNMLCICGDDGATHGHTLYSWDTK